MHTFVAEASAGSSGTSDALGAAPGGQWEPAPSAMSPADSITARPKGSGVSGSSADRSTLAPRYVSGTELVVGGGTTSVGPYHRVLSELREREG
ncbi:hypothetical protein GCM10007147_39250 [Nocardiopsis kunsanensis]|uniref:Uncharacterized protein n=1 Tax=Nocardiopsis kunsanensis TaxID=141693 RepID=A0A919CL65_9ACTN|nr:hypothetical protein GCM10007147_39250 [Nocardiopsis kunsanensis]